MVVAQIDRYRTDSVSDLVRSLDWYLGEGEKRTLLKNGLFGMQNGVIGPEKRALRYLDVSFVF